VAHLQRLIRSVKHARHPAMTFVRFRNCELLLKNSGCAKRPSSITALCGVQVLSASDRSLTAMRVMRDLVRHEGPQVRHSVAAGCQV
jgi:hypothetical protein